MSALLRLSLVTVIFMMSELSIGREGSTNFKGSRPEMSEECKSLISQMKELRIKIRERMEAIKAENPDQEEGGRPPDEQMDAYRAEKDGIKSQLESNNCPKPKRKGGGGKVGRGRGN